MFGSVVAGAFQITFRAKIHVNDVFSFFKNYFWYQHIKMIQIIQTILNFSKKKKISNCFGNAAAAAFPNVLVTKFASKVQYNEWVKIKWLHVATIETSRKFKRHGMCAESSSKQAGAYGAKSDKLRYCCSSLFGCFFFNFFLFL